MRSDWFKTPYGDACPWCEVNEFEPTDSDDAEMTLCRGHLAEYEGISLVGLDRQDEGIRADMTNLGYFD